ncbi:MAG TPA: hypothetical protein VL547_04735 [Dinghuibacter sp.]|jgi:hypothetical protein|uniref:hypothetical protein n=1 Tax=Dinghuibacter sp. TaxID=2024697 RepID=UPI002D1C10AA|nr:hypothetical protein [Dinghuibacter sp.]HTJ11302.1 hypothetical protein [Dinghuibacter sp.]
MEWYNYVAAFFSGAFLANFVPHFVAGIQGNTFPSPFSKPRGIGPSSPTVNVIWGIVNLAAGCLLFKSGHVGGGDWCAVIAFFAGLALLSVMMSRHFQKKQL